MRSGVRIAAAVAVAALAAAVPAQAAPGDLDPGFGTNGLIPPRTGDARFGQFSDLAVVGGDRFLTFSSGRSSGGEARAWRFDGTRDDAFGDDGIGRVPVARETETFAGEIDANGAVLMAGSVFRGWVFERAFVARLDGQGQPDGSFGERGSVLLPLVAGGIELEVDAQGRILVSGRTPDGEPAVARLLGNGSLDEGFGDGGIARLSLPAGVAVSGLVAAGSELVLSASGSPSARRSRAFLVNLDELGALDPSFGEGGVAELRMGSRGTAVGSLGRDEGGRILAAGVAHVRKGSDAVVARLTADGELDRAFSKDGIARPRSPGREAGFIEHVVSADGRILAAGSSDREWLLARFRPDGRRDRTFGRRGRRTLSVGGEFGEASEVALLRHRILALGTRGESGFRSTFIQGVMARFLNRPGPRDADADGFRDRPDRCPGTPGPRFGCPFVARVLRLSIGYSHLAERDALLVRVRAADRNCRQRTPIDLVRKQPGRDRAIARKGAVGARSRGFRVPERSGRYYARARRAITSTGICAAARSNTVLVR